MQRRLLLINTKVFAKEKSRKLPISVYEEFQRFKNYREANFFKRKPKKVVANKKLKLYVIRFKQGNHKLGFLKKKTKK